MYMYNRTYKAQTSRFFGGVKSKILVSLLLERSRKMRYGRLPSTETSVCRRVMIIDH